MTGWTVWRLLWIALAAVVVVLVLREVLGASTRRSVRATNNCIVEQVRGYTDVAERGPRYVEGWCIRVVQTNGVDTGPYNYDGWDNR